MKAFKKLYETIEANLKVAIAILVTIEGAEFVIGRFGPFIPLFGPWLIKYYSFLLQIVSAISFAGFILSIIFIAREKDLRRNLVADMAVLAKSRDLLKEDNDKLRRFLINFNVCSQHYRTLASRNAVCDWKIFNYLYTQYRAHPEGIETQLEMSIASINDNIKNILDAAKRVYVKHTGAECAVCLQILKNVEGATIDDAVISTAVRDSDSAISRPPSDTKFYVRDNSYHKKIFAQGQEYVVENDLRAALLRGEFTTSSGEWETRYNALLIIPIPNVAAVAENHITEAAAAAIHAPRATLCVDSLVGTFDGDLPIHIAKELAWRVAVLVWRVVHLQRDLKTLRTGTSHGYPREAVK